MSPAPKILEPVHYAAFRLRFRALRIDLGYCLGVFVIGGLVTAILLEDKVMARVAIAVAILIVILLYEPFMVARYGGTFGHLKCNIRIVRAGSDSNLPFWRAAVQSLVKQVFGLPSFVFMFVTSRSQGFHDLLAGAEVVLRDSTAAAEGDRFIPMETPAGRPATRARRLMVMLACNAVLLICLAVACTAVSSACIERNSCSASESLTLSIASTIWFVLSGLSIVTAWKGRLPGCRPSDPPA